MSEAFEHIRANPRQIHFGCAVSHAAAAELFVALASFAGKPVHIVFNSYGGDVDAALACYDAIRLYPGHVRGSVVGTCQSAAVLLFLACDERDVSQNSQIMIHEGTQHLGKLHPDEFEAQVGAMRVAGNVFNRLVAERSGMPLAKVKQLSRFATYFSAEEALQHGFASDILEAKAAVSNPADGKAKCSLRSQNCSRGKKRK